MNIPKTIAVTVFFLSSSIHSTWAQPNITSCKWKSVVINGTTYKKDRIITPTGHSEWYFDKTDNTKSFPTKTQHGTSNPGQGGITIADVKKIENAAGIIILSRGQVCSLITDGDLKRMEDLPQGSIKYLRDKGKTVYCLPTPDAVKKYQELIESGKKVAMLLHITC